ncbi:MAG: hypothetical protein AB1796_10945 [Bacillota bacterium]
MRGYRWENSLAELCGSPEEETRLKETASLFARLPEPHYSSSFRQELREKLLAEAAKQGQEIQRRRGFVADLAEKWGGSRSWWRTRSFGVVAAGILLFFLAVSVLNNPAPRSGGPAVLEEPEQTESPLLADTGSSMPESHKPLTQPPAAQEAEPGAGEKPSREDVKAGTAEQATAHPGAEGKPSAGGSAVRDHKPAVPAEEPGTAPALPDEPGFNLLKNRRTFTLAGNIIYNYGPLADLLYPVENINVNWQPNKITPAATPETYRFGTPEWAGRLLTAEGFRVKAGESIGVNIQETTQGLYAEVVYQVSPALVLHVHKERGIIAYYYEEKGAVAPQGYYSLLTPLDALKQLQELKSPIEGQQLRFSFREVKLTYHDFLLEEAGSVKTVRLPAYCFTGSELLQGKEGINFYLPAVKISQ